MSSIYMSTAMLWKQRPSHPNGRHLVLRAQRRWGEGTAKAQQDQDLVIVFFDWEGVVHHKHTPPGQTINKEYYLNVLRQWRDAIPENSCSYRQPVTGSFITTTCSFMHHKGFCSVLNSGRDARRTMWGPKVPALKGTEVSLSFVQCFLYLLQ